MKNATYHLLGEPETAIEMSERWNKPSKWAPANQLEDGAHFTPLIAERNKKNIYPLIIFGHFIN